MNRQQVWGWEQEAYGIESTNFIELIKKIKEAREEKVRLNSDVESTSINFTNWWASGENISKTFHACMIYVQTIYIAWSLKKLKFIDICGY